MICKHCGKEFSEEFKYCPYCAEPVQLLDRLTEEQRANYYKNRTGTKNRIVSVLLGIVMFPISWVAIYLWNFIDCIFNDVDYYGGWTISLYSFLISVSVVIIGFSVEHFKSDKQKLIDIQFDEDQTSICPSCGSHNVQIYRNGYNYSRGFWGAIFGVRGDGYAAGFDANKTRCRCMDCGKDWETDYDYRLVKKG